MDEPFDLGPVPKRLTVDPELVSRLVDTLFPAWAGLPISPVPRPGWDNWTFRLGDDKVVRLPSAAEYAEAVAKEQHWLPRLAPLLPVRIPRVEGVGRPAEGFPFAWSVLEWLDGETVEVAGVASPVGLAADLVGFVAALWRVDASEGPGPGVHNWFRGGTLRTFEPQVDRSLEVLERRDKGEVDVDGARRVWREALETGWDGIPRWFHGDVSPGNLLLDGEGRLVAVIDFGTCGVGDPSCDLAAAWTLLTEEGRSAFRDSLGVDDGLWLRGKGWALWKALVTCANTVGAEADRAEFDEARRVVETIVGDRS